jgi:uncharacterized protein YukE
VSAFLGASPQELESLANVFLGFSQTLDTRRREINTRLHTAGWEGDHADQFRAEWNSKHYPLLTNLVAALASAAVTLRYEAQQQDWASGAPPTGHRPTPSPGSGATASQVASELENRITKWGALAGPLGLVVQGAISDIKEAGQVEHDLAEGHYQQAFNQVSQIASSELDQQSASNLEHGDFLVAACFFFGAADVKVITDVEQAFRVNAPYANWELANGPELYPWSPGMLNYYVYGAKQVLGTVGAQIEQSGTQVLGDIGTDAKNAVLSLL